MEAAGWQQHHRIPAFGDWNYNYHDGAGVDDWPPVTPCFDFTYAMRTSARPAAQQKSSERSSMPNATRRMRIPAFGEWNHHGEDGGNGNGNGNGIGIAGNGAWPAVMTPFFDLATTPQKVPKTAGRPRRGGDGFGGAAKLAATAAEAPQGHGQTRRSKVADSGAAYVAAAARRSCFTVAKPVDDDLYGGVPPDMMLYGKQPGPRKDGWQRMILRLLGCSSCLGASR